MTRARWALLAVLVIAAGAGAWLARPAPLTAPDVEQPRLSTPAPLPAPGTPLNQTFIARHNGLSAVEVQIVTYGDPEAATGTLTLSLWGPGNRLVSQETRQGLVHNATVRLSFPPQAASAGQTYRLEALGQAAGQTTLWAYALDGYQGGALRHAGAALPGDLTFRTYYTYRWPDWVRAAARSLTDLAGLAVPLWLVVLAPGLAALDLGRLGGFEQSRWARWGAALALSLALLPLAWLWASTVGLGWSRFTLGAAYAVVGALVAGRWVMAAARALLRPRVRVRAAAFPGSQPVPVRFAGSAAAPRWDRHDSAMALVVAGSVLLRLLAVRDLTLPAWVDSSHHALLARLLAEGGRLPATYGPALGDGIFTYHFGIHTVFVALDWFSTLGLPAVMLAAGQVLNGLMPLAVYAGTAALTGRRGAGLGAAFFVGLVSFFPGYYATWGRYSQLAGLLVLPPAMGAAWALLAAAAARPAGGGQRRSEVPWHLVVGAGLLAAGVLLCHYRVFIFYAAFVLAAALVHARAGWRAVAWLALTAAVGGLLALPWVGRLLAVAVLPVVGEPGRLAAEASYNDFPRAYFNGWLERGALALALLAAAWGLLRRQRPLWALALWVGGLFALLNLARANWLVNNNAWAISLFVPAAMALGWGVNEWVAGARRLLAAPMGAAGPRWRRAARLGAGWAMLALAAGLAGYAGAAGARLQVGILNPVTLLARPDDLPALEWVAANTPEDAVFLISGWNWLGTSWTGEDGGAWVMPLTGRRSTLPPVTYSFGPRPTQVAVNALAARWRAIEDANAPETLALLRAEGVTHIFIGARGGHLKPEMFVDSPHYRLVFGNGAAWVFEVVGTGN